MSACRSCGADIVWAKTTAGKNIPIDANDFGDPIPKQGGNLRYTGRVRDGAPEVEFSEQSTLLDPDGPRFVTHFSTCKQADSWRKK